MGCAASADADARQPRRQHAPKPPKLSPTGLDGTRQLPVEAPVALPQPSSSLGSDVIAASWQVPSAEELAPAPAACKQQQEDPLLELGTTQYRKLGEVNEGSCGFVQLAEDLATGQKVAIKYLERGSRLKGVEREVINLRSCLACPYIVQFQQVFLTSKYMAIVTEYCPGGDLADHLDDQRSRARSAAEAGLPLEHCRTVFQQLVLALHFSHKRGVAVRDVKLENLLLTSGTGSAFPSGPWVKLCDFGFSKDETTDSQCRTACGTPEYVAPEVLSTQLYDGRRADIWSAGVLLYCLLTGTYPFEVDEDTSDAQRVQSLFPRIMRADFPRPAWLPADVLDLLERMLTVDSAKRITAAGILEHPWCRQGLPEGCIAQAGRLMPMADLVATTYSCQSEAEIKAICRRARRAQSDDSAIDQEVAVKREQIEKRAAPPPVPKARPAQPAAKPAAAQPSPAQIRATLLGTSSCDLTPRLLPGERRPSLEDPQVPPQRSRAPAQPMPKGGLYAARHEAAPHGAYQSAPQEAPQSRRSMGTADADPRHTQPGRGKPPTHPPVSQQAQAASKPYNPLAKVDVLDYAQEHSLLDTSGACA